MESIRIEVEERQTFGKEITKKMRANGKMPLVVYGKHTETMNFSVNAKEMRKHLTHGKGKNNIFTLVCKDKEYSAITYDIQFHPISKAILHMDMKLVKANEKVRVHVPIHKHGVSIGSKKGGKLIQKIEMLVINVSPNEIPKEIIVDITSLDMGQEITLKDLNLPASAEVYKTDLSQVVFTVKAISTEPLFPEDVVDSALSDAGATATTDATAEASSEAPTDTPAEKNAE